MMSSQVLRVASSHVGVDERCQVELLQTGERDIDFELKGILRIFDE